MKVTLPLTLLFILFSVGVSYGSDDLWINEVNIKSDGGKDLIMKFEELNRASDYSVIRVEFTSGASVLSIMFIVQGFYTIAKQRVRTILLICRNGVTKTITGCTRLDFPIQMRLI